MSEISFFDYGLLAESQNLHGIYSVNIYGNDASALAAIVLVLKIC